MLPLSIIVLIMGIYFLYSPTEFSFFPQCPFYKYAGFHCAGCGSQRALHHLLHLDILGMLRNNLLLPFWIYLGLDYFYKKMFSEKDPLLLNTSVPWVIFAFILSYMILRNIPISPFTYLAPTL